MKHKVFTLFLMLAIVISVSGCAKETEPTNVNREAANLHKAVVVVVDRETKSPIRNAKVFILGGNITCTTDEMGKTPELEIELNKEYFSGYREEVAGRMRSGLVSVLVKAEGYSKHLEVDKGIFPGDSISIVRVELAKGNSYTVNSNSPDTSYVENLLKAYEKYEGEEIKSENIIKYKVTVADEKNKPIEGARVVIPEAKAVGISDKKGVCEFNVPYVEINNMAYPVNKGYGEITVLVYKEGYLPKAVMRVHTDKKSATNSLVIKIKKSSRPGVECEVVKPSEEWARGVLDWFKE